MTGFGIAGLALILTNILAPALIALAAVSVSIGAITLAVSGIARFVQKFIYGFPKRDEEPMFESDIFRSPDVQAELTVNDREMPILKIIATNPYSAGYAEGFLLGKAIRANLKKLNVLYRLLGPFIGAPSDDEKLSDHLAGVLKTIPLAYQDEMQGKVDGYNVWLAENHPGEKELSFHCLLLYQLIPDFHNFNPFTKSSVIDADPAVGCTTIALRVGDYTFFVRILDWTSYDVAGHTFIQIDRKIGDVKRTVDIANPLMSGVATVLNEDGLLLQVNVSPSEKVKTQPQGMPAIFFNRLCIENNSTVEELREFVKTRQPLAAYHLTATDGSLGVKSRDLTNNSKINDMSIVET